MKSAASDPTRAELEILQVLWSLGPQPVRGVWSALGGRGSYTTVLKLLQIMFEKQLVQRDASEMTHVYRAAVDEAVSRKKMVGGLIERAFGGSISQLVLSALSAKPASRGELEAIRKLLKQSADASHKPARKGKKVK